MRIVPDRIDNYMRSDQTIAAWEDDGGALKPVMLHLVGTENQMVWAEQIRANANAEFDRVAAALEAVALLQREPNQSRTRMFIAVLEEQRSSVMARSDAGYFIREWQELRDQVRLLIAHDPRCKTQD
jgi:hypothetical protein